ncbi:bifunctional folylpolyglutamate synthase/dihydrofolate synthase [Actinomycetaceae bacterium TAE3-ERU4]|nr:bifunctional folylpolyglutamate synthase/dihydrofolate synthase [Actinomycetaceae bacterium TAE3-ERU4]
MIFAEEEMDGLDPLSITPEEHQLREDLLTGVIDDRTPDLESSVSSLSSVGKGNVSVDDPQDLARVAQCYAEIVARLPEHSPNPSLDKVTQVLELMGNPQDSLSYIHVGGTNGKTSTTRMIDSLLSAAGLRVGRFTSPHLVDVRERISIGGKPISASAFLQAYEDVSPFVQMVDEACHREGRAGLSFFEFFTVMAFAAFAAAPVDVAVMEVGMGGRWDATNVIDAQVSVITPISLDHQRWLGSTCEEIAKEKSGIIKPGATVVLAPQLPEVEAVMFQAAKASDAIVRLSGRDFSLVDYRLAVGGQSVTIQSPAALYEEIPLPLFGKHQAQNAALALSAVEAFLGGKALSGELVEGGFLRATSPGRLEVIKGSPTIIADAAHNPAGMESLVAALEENFGFTRVYGVFSAMADKAVEEMLGILEPAFEEIVVVQMPGERAMSIEELASLADDVFGADRVHKADTLEEALEKAVELSQDGGDSLDANGTVVCGSISLVGSARALCKLS